MVAAKRALEVRLEEAQRGLARLGQEQQALSRALEEEGKQREVLRRSKAELEEQKRLLDRTVDRLNKEVGPGCSGPSERGPAYTEACLGVGWGEAECGASACFKDTSGVAGSPCFLLPPNNLLFIVFIPGGCFLEFCFRSL